MTTTVATPTARPWLPGISRRWTFAAAALVLLTILAIVATSVVRARATQAYVTTPVVRQTLVASVTASGTVNPQNEVSVGSQTSGTISQILVDYNSKVTKGEVLARIDPSSLQAQLDQADAQVAQAQAQAAEAAANAAAQSDAVASAQSSIGKAQAVLSLAQRSASRDRTLLSQGYVAASAVDADNSTVAQDASDVTAARAAANQSAAGVQADDAGIAAANDAVSAALAAARGDQLNVAHTVIVSPVDGTVVARDVSVGQTVAASLQTPTLFAIAQDLGKMEIDINVGEPDIGDVKAGDRVSFSVLAYPNRVFTGSVAQVRINPQTVNNVVTYDVVVLASNADGALLPGMTANATIDVGSAADALVVPATALSWAPQAGRRTAGSPWGTTSNASAAMPAAGSNATLYALQNGKPVAVPVTVLLTTSTQAAVAPVDSNALAPGDGIVVASATGTHAARSAPASPMQSNPAAATRGIH